MLSDVTAGSVYIPMAGISRQAAFSGQRQARIFRKGCFLTQVVQLTHGGLVSPPTQTNSCPEVFFRQLNIFTIFSKEARIREGERLAEELNRGYFDDFKELKKTGGKVVFAPKKLIPQSAALKFPDLTVRSTDGAIETLPSVTTTESGDNAAASDKIRATLIFLAFRANGQPMVESWKKPFLDAFNNHNRFSIYEVSMVESPLLSFAPFRYMLLRSMKPSKPTYNNVGISTKVVYAFGDTWKFRKSLGIVNRMTTYVYVLDEHGRVRWRASGLSTQEELNSMLACTRLLIEEKIRP